jgi:steroid 5-alpha reductase family enzyme
VETFAELQRKVFKDQPANRGKVFMRGSLAWRGILILVAIWCGVLGLLS